MKQIEINPITASGYVKLSSVGYIAGLSLRKILVKRKKDTANKKLISPCFFSRNNIIPNTELTI